MTQLKRAIFSKVIASKGLIFSATFLLSFPWFSEMNKVYLVWSHIHTIHEPNSTVYVSCLILNHTFLGLVFSFVFFSIKHFWETHADQVEPIMRSIL